MVFNCHLSFAQKKQVVSHYEHHCDTISWFNRELQSQVQDVHGNFIRFSKRSQYLQLTPEKIPPHYPKAHLRIYQLGFGAARELWAKKFGAFPEKILTDKFEILQQKQNTQTYFEGTIFRDSIVITMHWEEPVMIWVAAKDEEDYRVFERVRFPTGFQNGPKALELLLNEQLANTKINVPSTDSIIYFQGVIKKDSMIHNIELLEPVKWSPFTRKLVEIFESQQRKWLPFVREMVLNVYQLIYIRVRPDGKIEADFPID